ncbi:MAG: hypothetical protein NTY82_04890 [Actinobacteria bacterium]|nr:hypothetical protein [Actinomycetota bacterium]
MSEDLFAHVQYGLDTFGDATVDAQGVPLSHAQVLRNVVDEAVLADDLGIDFFGIGEHHRSDFAVSAPEGALFVGSPETVARKIARTVAGLGLSRFDLKYSLGTLSHEHLMECIRLYGEQVIPRVREILATEYSAVVA